MAAWVSDEDMLHASEQNACRSFLSLQSWNRGLFCFVYPKIKAFRDCGKNVSSFVGSDVCR